MYNRSMFIPKTNLHPRKTSFSCNNGPHWLNTRSIYFFLLKIKRNMLALHTYNTNDLSHVEFSVVIINLLFFPRFDEIKITENVYRLLISSITFVLCFV